MDIIPTEQTSAVLDDIIAAKPDVLDKLKLIEWDKQNVYFPIVYKGKIVHLQTEAAKQYAASK